MHKPFAFVLDCNPREGALQTDHSHRDFTDVLYKLHGKSLIMFMCPDNSEERWLEARLQ